MRCLTTALVVVAAALGLAAAPAHAARPPATWTPDVAAARAYANSRHAAAIAFAVRTEHGLWGVGLDQAFPSASVVKAMLLAAYLRRPGVRHRDLRAADRALLDPMVRRSDNIAATRVRDIVGNAGLMHVARAAGMTRFATASSWGSSQITARDQTRFFLHIDARLPARHRAYGMELLRTIVPSQRWGLARVIPADWTLYFKSGWGSGSGAIDNQVGLLHQDGDRVAVAVLTLGNPSHRYGKVTLEGTAARLLAGLGGALEGSAGPVVAGLPRR